MRGEVLRYDDNAGTGLILGADGARYNFTSADLKQILPVPAGTIVGFEGEGIDARNVYIAPQPAVRPAQRRDAAAEPERDLFEYFKRAFSHHYAKFDGRARRKEYWGFHLFYGLIVVALWLLAAFVAGIGSSGFRPGALYYVVMGALVIFLLATVVPALAVFVRRLHDVGLSGWVLLILIAGNLIPIWFVNWITIIATIVIACIDSQPHVNRYGQMPKRLYS